MSRTKKDTPTWVLRKNAAQKTGFYEHNHHKFGVRVMGVRRQKDAEGNHVTEKRVSTDLQYRTDRFGKQYQVLTYKVVETYVNEPYVKYVYTDRCTAHEDLSMVGARQQYLTEDGTAAPCMPGWYYEAEGVVVNYWRTRPSAEGKRLYHHSARSSEKVQLGKMRQRVRALPSVEDIEEYESDDFEIMKNTRQQRHVGWWD